MEFSLTLIIIVVTVLISIKGFSDDMFRAKAMFYPYEIKEQKEWYRFLTSGFLHADWLHLIVNMYVLYMFGPILEKAYIELTGEAGRIIYLLMYLTAIAMANVSTYFKHKDYRGYAALGASGAVSAVVFAGILIWPDMELMLLFLPIVIPFLTAIVAIPFYVVMSDYGLINTLWALVFAMSTFAIPYAIWVLMKAKKRIYTLEDDGTLRTPDETIAPRLHLADPLDKARQIASDICNAIDDYRFVWQDKIFNIGISVGLIEISRESGAPDEVMSAADSACCSSCLASSA